MWTLSCEGSTWKTKITQNNGRHSNLNRWFWKVVCFHRLKKRICFLFSSNSFKHEKIVFFSWLPFSSSGHFFSRGSDVGIFTGVSDSNAVSMVIEREVCSSSKFSCRFICFFSGSFSSFFFFTGVFVRISPELFKGSNSSFSNSGAVIIEKSP